MPGHRWRRSNRVLMWGAQWRKPASPGIPADLFPPSCPTTQGAPRNLMGLHPKPVPATVPPRNDSRVPSHRVLCLFRNSSELELRGPDGVGQLRFRADADLALSAACGARGWLAKLPEVIDLLAGKRPSSCGKLHKSPLAI